MIFNVLTRHRLPKPTLFIFGDTRTPQQILESIWKHPGKIWFLERWDSKISKISDHVCTQLVERFKFWNFEILTCFYIKWLYIEKIFLRRWGIENDTFFIIKQHPQLGFEFHIYQKTWTGFTRNFVFSRNVP